MFIIRLDRPTIDRPVFLREWFKKGALSPEMATEYKEQATIFETIEAAEKAAEKCKTDCFYWFRSGRNTLTVQHIAEKTKSIPVYIQTVLKF